MKSDQENNSKIVRNTSKWWQLFLSYKFVVVSIVLVALLVGTYISFTTVKNEINATLRIALKYNESNKRNYSDYTDEMTGINSNSLVLQTIDELKLNVSYFKKNNENYVEITDSLPIEMRVGLATPYIFEKYTSFTILDSASYQLSYLLNDKLKTIKCKFDSALVNDELKIVVSKSAFWNSADTSNNFYMQFHNTEHLVQQYKSAMSVKLSKDLAILDVFLGGNNEKRTLSFLDTLGKNYLTNTITVQLERDEKTIKSIDKLICGTQLILNRIEDSLRTYCHNSGLLDAKFENQKNLSVLTSLMLDKRNIDLQKRGLQDIDAYLAANLDRKGVPPPVISEIVDPFIKKSMDKLYENYISKKDMQLDITKKNYINERIDYKYDIFITDLKSYLKDAIKTTETKSTFFAEQIAEIEQKSTGAYTKEQLHVLDLERQLKVNEALYANLLEKKSNILISESSMPSEYRLVQAATLLPNPPASPSGPILFSLLIGLAIAFVFLTVMNIFFEKVETLEELLEKTNLSVLGEVPMILMSTDTVDKCEEILTNPIAQGQLSSIRTNLQFALSGNKTKTILLTSHTSSEGKTFNAVSLAAILAKTKKRVLIIDFDLHKPSVKNMLQLLDSTKDLTDVYDNAAPIKNCISKTPNEYLDALVAFEAAIDPSEKILLDTTQQIIDYAKNEYDYVIIDTPPIGIIADALSVMNQADIMLYIINSAIPFRNSLKQVEDLQAKTGFNIRLVLNKVKIQRLRYYSKAYLSYRYGYAKKAS